YAELGAPMEKLEWRHHDRSGNWCGIAAWLLLLLLAAPTSGQAINSEKNPDLRSDCEKEPYVLALQDKVLYGYPEMEPCYEIALIECQMRGLIDPKRKAELEGRKAAYVEEANDKRLSCSGEPIKKTAKLNILISRQYEGGSYTDPKDGGEEGCITGYLAINGKTVAYTLELPYRNNQSS